MSKTLLRTLALAVVLFGTTGCFTYVPTPIGTTPPGTGVQIVVTPEGAEQIEAVRPSEGQAPTVRGTLLALEDGEVVLNVPVTRLQQGFTGSTIFQQVRVPADEVVSFQQRELDSTATIFLSVGAVAVAAGIAVLLSEGLRGENPDPTEPPDEFAPGVSIPWISIGVGR